MLNIIFVCVCRPAVCMFLLAVVHGKVILINCNSSCDLLFTTCIIVDVIGHVSYSILAETMDLPS